MFTADHLRLENLPGGLSLEKTDSPFSLYPGLGLVRLSPSALACELAVSLCGSHLGDNVVEIQWLQLSCHFQKTLR